MLELRDRMLSNIVAFLERIGFDPVVATTAFIVIITLTQWRDFKRWDKLPEYRQGFLKALLFANAVVIIGCVLYLAGAF